MHSIDFNDIDSVSTIMKSDWLTSGPKIKEFEKKICQYLGAKYCVVVSSGTAALNIAIKSLNIEGNEIITTPFTYVADANAIVNNNCIPVFSDINQETFNLDPDKIKLGENSKAILYVDYAGHPCDIEKINQIAKKNNLYTIEDGAHAFGSQYKDKMIGNFADLTIFSFHPSKSITTGEGGCVVTNNLKLYNKLLKLRHHGLDRSNSNFKWDYDIKQISNNYRLSDIQCTLGISQLEKIEDFIDKRRKIIKEYNQGFSDVKEIRTPIEKENVRSAWYTYPILLDENIDRNVFYKKLTDKGVNAQVYYKPITHLTYYKNKFHLNEKDYPVTESVFNRLINLPVDESIENVRKIIMFVKNLINNVEK